MIEVLEAIIRSKDEASDNIRKMNEILRQTPVEFKAMGAAAQTAQRDMAGFEGSVRSFVNELSGRNLRQEVGALAVAVEKLGGASKLSAPALETLKAKLAELHGAGAKIPATLQGLIPPQATAGAQALGAATQQLQGQMQNMAGSLGPVGSLLTALGPAGIAGAASFAALAGAASTFYGTLGSLTSALMSTADGLADLSAKSGVGVEALQAWGYAAEQSGIKGDRVAMMMTNLSARLEEGGKQASKGVEALGLSLATLNGMDTESQFRVIIEGLAGIKDQGEQAAAAKEIFGVGWRDALTLVRDGALETADAAKGLGVVLDADLVASAAHMADTTATLEKQWEALKMQFVSSIADSKEVQQFLDELVKLMAALIPLAAEAGSAMLKFAQMIRLLPNEGDLRGLRLLADMTKTVGAQIGILKEPMQNGLANTGSWVGPLQQLQQEHEKTSKSAQRLKTDLEKLTEAARLSVTLTKYSADQLASEQKRRATESGAIARGQLKRIQEMQAAEKALEEQRKASHKAAKDNYQELAEIEARRIQQWQEERERLEEFMGLMANLRSLFEAVGADFLANIVGAFEQGVAAADAWANATTKAGQAAALVQGATAAYGSGSVVGGAMTGATMGMAIGGPIGAGIGAVAGGILGLFGGKAKVKKELADLRAQLLQSVGGSMEELRKRAAALGVDISKAFSTKNPKELKAIIDQLNKAAEEQKKRWEGVQTALGGLELRTQGFAASMANVNEALAKDEDSWQRLGRYAVATFGAYVRETGDVIGALKAMDGTLGSLADLQQKFGFVGGAAITQLLGMRDVLMANQGVADSLQGLNQLMQGLADQGGITRALFQDFGTDAGAIFNQLIAGGADSNTAMALMQPTLQRLWEAQRKYGAVTDETTAALIKQAEEQGLVGENMMSVNEQILNVLVAIGEALGATIPDALRRMGNTAVSEFDRAGDAADRFSNRVPDLSTNGGSGDTGTFGEPKPGGVPGFAVGGTVTRPTLAMVGEAGTEHILSPAQLQGYMAAAIKAAGVGSGGGAVHVYLDGAPIDARVERSMERGRIAPSRGRLKVRG